MIMSGERSPGPDAALIKCTIEGLEVEADWPALQAWLLEQKHFSALCMDVVTGRRGGVGVVIRLPQPKTATFRWRGYDVEATAFLGELRLICRKSDGPALPTR